MGSVESSLVAQTKSRIAFFVIVLNLILLAVLLYRTFGRSLTPGGGISFALINATPAPMLDVTLQYPGGKLSIPRLNPSQQVGQPVAYGSEFEATLSYKDEENHPHQNKFIIRPLDELLVLIYVLPVMEETVIKAADGIDQKVYKISPSKSRVSTAYQGENTRLGDAPG